MHSASLDIPTKNAAYFCERMFVYYNLKESFSKHTHINERRSDHGYRKETTIRALARARL